MAAVSVLDNAKIACHFHVQYGLPESILRLGRYYRGEEAVTRSAEVRKVYLGG